MGSGCGFHVMFAGFGTIVPCFRDLHETVEGQGLLKPGIVVGCQSPRFMKNGLCKKKSPQFYVTLRFTITAN